MLYAGIQTLQYWWASEESASHKGPRVCLPSIERELASLLPFHFLLLKCLTPSSLTSHRPIRYSVLRQLSSLTDHPTYQLIAVSFRSHQPTQHFRPAPPREPTTATAKTHLRKVLSPYYTSLPPSLQQAHLTQPSRDRNAQNVRHRITPTEARGRRAPQH